MRKAARAAPQVLPRRTTEDKVTSATSRIGVLERRRARDVAWMLEAFTGRDLRELASLCDLRDKRRRNQWLALWAGPPLCDPRVPLPPLLPEVLGAAMSYLAWEGWSDAGLFRAATVYNAGRLGPWIVRRVVREVLARRDRRAMTDLDWTPDEDVEDWEQYQAELAQDDRQTAPEHDDDDIKAPRKSASTVLFELAQEHFHFGVSDAGDTFAVPKSGPKVVRMLHGGKTSLRSGLAASTSRGPAAPRLSRPSPTLCS